jgi:hypothetical protein
MLGNKPHAQTSKQTNQLKTRLVEECCSGSVMLQMLGNLLMKETKDQCCGLKPQHTILAQLDWHHFSCDAEEVSLNVGQHSRDHRCRDTGSTTGAAGTMSDGLACQILPAEWARSLQQEPPVHALAMEAVSARQLPGIITAMQGSKTDGADGLLDTAD